MDKIINLHVLLFIGILTFLVFLLNASPQIPINENNKKSRLKLILTPELNDSIIELDSGNVNTYCVILNIDTIQMNSIIYLDKNNQEFIYNNNKCYISQLFELDEIESLLKTKVIFFGITSNYKYEPPVVSSNSEYITTEQLNYIKTCVRTHINRNFSDTLKFYITDIRLSNEFKRYKKWSYRRSILNSINLNLR